MRFRKLQFLLLSAFLLPASPALAGGATYGQISPLEYAKGPHIGKTVEFELANGLTGIFIYRTATSVGPGQSVSIDGGTPKSVEAQTFIYRTVNAGEHKLIVPEGNATHAYDFPVERSPIRWMYIRLNVVTENGVTKVVPTSVDHEIAKIEIKDCGYIN